MQAWHFSESAYPYLPPADSYPSIRVSLASKNYDPKKGAALWDRYLHEWQIAEEEGMDIMLNEHHQTATCVDPAAPMVLAALARLTTTARLLILSQVILSLQLPFAVIPLMLFAGDRKRLGGLVAPRWQLVLGWAAAALIVVLNGKLLAGMIGL
jgi:hypothetical protein